MGDGFPIDPILQPVKHYPTHGRIQEGMIEMRRKTSVKDMNRRRFMNIACVLGIGAIGTALAPDGLRIEREQSIVAQSPDHEHEANVASNQTSASESDELTADEMDAMHEAGIKAFPAETHGLGGQPLQFELDGDVKVFRLTCQLTNREFAPGEFDEAWTYNGVVPGPEIRVTEGDKARFEVTNELPQSTAVHWHGLVVPNDQNGVPFITQPPIKPGQTFTYEFPIRDGNAGTHMYHAHHNSAFQVTRGLLDSFIVEPKDPSSRPPFDREYTIVLNDGPIGGYSLNGKSFPATQPLMARRGEKVLIRYMNEGFMIHPMHLHGMLMTVTAADGSLLPQPYMCDTLNIAPVNDSRRSSMRPRSESGLSIATS
jgi:FtsP/CotA-like multicopper oxidase with cupredoxin domain